MEEVINHKVHEFRSVANERGFDCTVVVIVRKCADLKSCLSGQKQVDRDSTRLKIPVGR